MVTEGYARKLLQKKDLYMMRKLKQRQEQGYENLQ